MFFGEPRVFVPPSPWALNWGFSWVGLVFMLSLQIPNIIWAHHQPVGYDPRGESKVMRIFERIGQVLCTATILLFANTMPASVAAASRTPRTPWTSWIGWFFASIGLMVIYEFFWVRYFRGRRTMHDFYRPLLGVPAPGATLPVVAFLLLAIYGRLWPLIISAIILGIGHIGIHLGHMRKLRHDGGALAVSRRD